MTEATAYHNPNAPVYRQWIAYMVLDDGKLWGVYATGATEEAAKAKIETLWNKEGSKITKADPWATVTTDKQHHFAGKIWMRHKETRDLVRVPLTEISLYEGNGYERSGPRSK